MASFLCPLPPGKRDYGDGDGEAGDGLRVRTGVCFFSLAVALVPGLGLPEPAGDPAVEGR
jgi:hypothetical protein